jgi:hypothetical protein
LATLARRALAVQSALRLVPAPAVAAAPARPAVQRTRQTMPAAAPQPSPVPAEPAAMASRTSMAL